MKHRDLYQESNAGDSFLAVQTFLPFDRCGFYNTVIRKKSQNAVAIPARLQPQSVFRIDQFLEGGLAGDRGVRQCTKQNDSNNSHRKRQDDFEYHLGA